MALTVTTFNIRTGAASDGPNAWPLRRALAADTLAGADPDLVALQEPTREQYDQVLADLRGYAGVFGDRQDRRWPDSHGEAILFRTGRFSLLRSDIVWLSDTPWIPGTCFAMNHWGARIAVIARLLDRATGKEMVLVSTHFDTHPDSWMPSARACVAEASRLAAGRPILIGGDFNVPAGHELWTYLTGVAGFRDAWLEAGLPDPGTITYHGFTGASRLPHELPEKLEAWLSATHGTVPEFSHYPALVRKFHNYRIDWIMLRGPWRCHHAVLDTRRKDGRCASDHYAVTARLDDA